MKKENNNSIDVIDITNISILRKEIAKYISSHRLTKVTIFEDEKYYGTLLFSKKTKVAGYSRLNKLDKKMDKSIGTLYSTYRYLNNIASKTVYELWLMDTIKDFIPKGYKNYVKKPNPVDDIYYKIMRSDKCLTVGYNRFDIQNSVVKYVLYRINNLEDGWSSQDITHKFKK